MKNSMEFMRNIEVDEPNGCGDEKINILNESFDVIMDVYSYLKDTNHTISNISINKDTNPKRLRISCNDVSNIIDNLNNNIITRYTNIGYEVINPNLIDIFAINYLSI